MKEKKLRIMLDGRLYGLENAGLGRYVINLVQELSKLDTKNDYGILLRKKYFENLTLPANWKKILADYPHYSFSEQTRLSKDISSFSPDLVHFPHFNVPLFYKGKFVVTIHDMLMHNQKGLEATTQPVPIYLLKRLGYRAVFDKAVKDSTAIIVPSSSVKAELTDFYKVSPGKVHVTYEGLDEKISGNGKADIQKSYFVYAGNAYPHKNLKRLIEATVLFNQKSKIKTTLAIASARNVFIERLQKMISKLKADNYVKLLGFVSDNELGALYKNSEAFVFPSISEGFGLPGLEAMNAGTLVAASDIPVFREVYKDNAIYFNPLDFSSIEEIMEKITEMSVEERKERIEKSQKFAKTYSWRKMAVETLNLYESAAHT